MELIKVLSAAIKKRTGAPAAQAVVQGKGITDVTSEVYPLPGLFVVPPNGSKLLLIPLEDGKTRVAVGGVNYQVSISQEQGGTTLYSTTADGKTVEAQIALSPAGLVSIKNTTKSLYTIMNSIITHLNSLTTTVTVSTSTGIGTGTISAATIANLTKDLSDLSALMEA